MATENSHSIWWTPRDLIEVLKREFPFDLDAAADEDNKICERFIDKEMDALVTPWKGKCVYVNPPYGEGLGSKLIAPFVKRAYEQHLEQQNTVVALLPAYTDPRYWRDYCSLAHEIRFLVGRLKFLDHGKSVMSARFPSVLVIWKWIPGLKYGYAPHTWHWDWRK